MILPSDSGVHHLHTELLAALSDRSRYGHWTLAAMTHPTVHGDGYRVSGDPCTDMARALNFNHYRLQNTEHQISSVNIYTQVDPIDAILDRIMPTYQCHCCTKGS
jgi:hypothetical protein